jgi:glycosyltransferase involved in cell wall biosynthesis
MAEVEREVPDARLVIVGEDDPRAAWEHGTTFSALLKDQAERLGIADRVVFTGFRTDIPRLMSALDVFCHPSWEEPFGMVFLEAMARRKPVVAWASGGAPEVIVHGETGLLVERASVSGLADALVRLLKDPELRRRFGDAGRQRVERLFTPEHMAGDTLQGYRAALKTGRPGLVPGLLPRS